MKVRRKKAAAGWDTERKTASLLLGVRALRTVCPQQRICGSFYSQKPSETSFSDGFNYRKIHLMKEVHFRVKGASANRLPPACWHSICAIGQILRFIVSTPIPTIIRWPTMPHCRRKLSSCWMKPPKPSTPPISTV